MCMNHPKCLKKNKGEAKAKPKAKPKVKSKSKKKNAKSNPKAVSKVQQMAAGTALAARQGIISPKALKGASKQMYASMSDYDLKMMAGTKRTGLPRKKNCWKDDAARHSEKAKQGWITRRARAKDKVATMAVKQEIKAVTKGKVIPSLIEVSYSADGNTMYVESPYNPQMSELGRGLGGKWDSNNKRWAYDARLESKVKARYEEMYGMWIDPVKDSVNLIININACSGEEFIYLAGRLVVERRGRDSRVNFGKGVILLTGGFPSSGGSVKNPRLYEFDNTTVEMMDVPRAKAEALAKKIPHICTIDQSLQANPLTAIKAKAILSQARKKFGKSNVTSLGQAIRLLSGKVVPFRANANLQLHCKNVATGLQKNSNLSEYIFTTDAYGLSKKKAAEKFVTSYWDKPRKIRGYKDGSFSVVGGTHQYKIYFIPSDKKTHPDMYGIARHKKDNPSLMVAKTILKQLGGNKFVSMVGAKNIAGGDESLYFDFKMCKKANKCRITLTPNDTYTVEFFKCRGGDCKLIKEFNNIYFDQLTNIFKSFTGLYTSLGSMKNSPKSKSKIKKWYYGPSLQEGLVVFSSTEKPTKQNCGDLVKFAVGPYNSKKQVVAAAKHSEIYDNILAIEAKKGKGSLWPNEDFRHDFKDKASIYGLPDGSVLIKGDKPLWKKFNYK